MTRVLVTGAAGVLGRPAVDRLHQQGFEVTAFVTEGSSIDLPAGAADRIDVIAGDVRRRTDVDAAVSNADVVLHLATNPARRSVDVDGSSNVAYACNEFDAHMLYVSIVGVDRSRFPYYRTKARVERTLAEIPGLGFTIQRATQFYPLLDQLLALPVIPMPGEAQFQPHDPADLANRLVGLIAAGPSGRVRDFAGPTVLRVDDMIEIREEVVGTVGRSIPIPRVNLFREAAAGLLVNPDADTGHRTYRDWLADQ